MRRYFSAGRYEEAEAGQRLRYGPFREGVRGTGKPIEWNSASQCHTPGMGQCTGTSAKCMQNTAPEGSPGR